jgi:hypothetical protein
MFQNHKGGKIYKDTSNKIRMKKNNNKKRKGGGEK